MAKTTKLGFLVQRAGYKCENPKLALTHAIASQTVDIYLEDGDAVVPVVAFVGEGVLNCKNNQRGMEVYDALYAWCRHARGETRGRNPEATQKAKR